MWQGCHHPCCKAGAVLPHRWCVRCRCLCRRLRFGRGRVIASRRRSFARRGLVHSHGDTSGMAKRRREGRIQAGRRPRRKVQVRGPRGEDSGGGDLARPAGRREAPARLRVHGFRAVQPAEHRRHDVASGEGRRRRRMAGRRAERRFQEAGERNPPRRRKVLDARVHPARVRVRDPPFHDERNLVPHPGQQPVGRRIHDANRTAGRVVACEGGCVLVLRAPRIGRSAEGGTPNAVRRHVRGRVGSDRLPPRHSGGQRARLLVDGLHGRSRRKARMAQERRRTFRVRGSPRTPTALLRRESVLHRELPRPCSGRYARDAVQAAWLQLRKAAPPRRRNGGGQRGRAFP